MPYPKDHKPRTRARIVEAARALFNTHGYDRVTLDMVMARAGLTRGGFYAHFSSKEELFAAAVDSFLMGRGRRWRDEAGVDPTRGDPVMAERMVRSYLGTDHRDDREGQCPLIALSSDVARSSEEVRAGYERLLAAMVWLFETNADPAAAAPRDEALSLAALCVGGMILSRTLPDSPLAEELRQAVQAKALAATRPGRADAA